MEHHSNIVPWHFLRERQGAVLKWVDVRDDGSLDIEALDAAIGPKTKLVAVTHMSNVLGTVTPLKEIVARAHAKGVPVLADGCQGAVHEIVDVQDAGHRFLCADRPQALRPHRHRRALRQARASEGHAALQWRRRDDPRSDPRCVTYADPPARFEAGTPPIIEAVGPGGGAGLSARRSTALRSKAHEHDLLAYAREAVREFNWLRVIGDAPGKGAILSFEAEGMHAHDLATILDREGVAVRAGHHCAQPLMERFGVASTSRASFALYNTRADVDALVSALAQSAEDFGLKDDGRYASRTLPGSDPRSFAPSAPFRRAGRRHPQGRGLQSALRRPRDGLSGAWTARMAASPTSNSRARAAPSARPRPR